MPSLPPALPLHTLKATLAPEYPLPGVFSAAGRTPRLGCQRAAGSSGAKTKPPLSPCAFSSRIEVKALRHLPQHTCWLRLDVNLIQLHMEPRMGEVSLRLLTAHLQPPCSVTGHAARWACSREESLASLRGAAVRSYAEHLLSAAPAAECL